MAPKRKKPQKKKKGDACQMEAVKFLAGWCKLSNACETPMMDLHSHSNCSDGLLSPEGLVERAFRRGVKVLALTDHDTMTGVPAAIRAALRYGMRIIPGVEISTIFQHADGKEESVHILAYYGCCGPVGVELMETLQKIRAGRYDRAQAMVDKLNKLNVPIKLEHVKRVAGEGVAPGRLHLARALVEAGHVPSIQAAFNRYLYDGGPAYATGCEVAAEEAVKLIKRTGGVSALAHPWCLKNPLPLIKKLSLGGLHAMEVYKANGSDKGFAGLADTYKLAKVGGSDFHGTTGGASSSGETDLGKVVIAPGAMYAFLKLAQPIWYSSLVEMIETFARRSLVCSSCEGDVEVCAESLKLSQWLEKEEMEMLAKEADTLGLMHSFEFGSLVLFHENEIINSNFSLSE